MSTVLILTPMVIGGWPAISAAAAGAAAALGLALKGEIDEMTKEHENQRQEAEIEIQESEVTEALHSGQEMVFGKGEVSITVRRDERGHCTVCAGSETKSKAELQKIAEEFSEKLQQVFTYNKVMTELKQKGFNMVNQEIMDDQSIRIHVRRWVD